ADVHRPHARGADLAEVGGEAARIGAGGGEGEDAAPEPAAGEFRAERPAVEGGGDEVVEFRDRDPEVVEQLVGGAHSPPDGGAVTVAAGVLALGGRSAERTSELPSRLEPVCRR